MTTNTEPTNEDKADFAHHAVRTYMKATGLTRADGLETAIGDLLADLMHLCRIESVDWDFLVLQAKAHFNEETE